jgi:hypothetical protein
VLGEADLGPQNAELARSWGIVKNRRVQIESQQSTGTGLMLYSGKSDGHPVELLVDADGLIKRGKCVCGHHQKAGIRMGPCRHLLALRQTVLEGPLVPEVTALSWYDRLKRWANN